LRQLLLMAPRIATSSCNLERATGLQIEVPATVCSYTHMRSREVIRALEAAGWSEVARKGSHVQFKHPMLPGRVTVPHPQREFRSVR